MNYNDILLFCSKNVRKYQVCSWATIQELSHKSRKDRTTYLDFLAKHKKWSRASL